MMVDGIPTKEEVLEAYEASRNFLGTIQSYVQMRAEIDPAWKSAKDFDAYSDTVAFDPDGDVEIEWTIWDRCGDREGFRKSFPAEHLWDPEAEGRIRAEVVLVDHVGRPPA
jgi:hypothetical protein